METDDPTFSSQIFLSLSSNVALAKINYKDMFMLIVGGWGELIFKVISEYLVMVGEYIQY